jgi:general secretion pathway protein N
MKKWFLGGAIFFTSYLVFIIASFPVSNVLNYLSMPKNIQLFDVSGTIWQTKITQAKISKINNNSIIINNIDVRLKISSLLMFKLGFDINFGGRLLDGPQGHLSVDNLLADIAISQANISLPANDISQQLSLPIDVNAFGKVTLQLDSYQLGKPICTSVSGKITWPKAALSAFEQTVNLGTLTANLSCEKGILAVEVDPKNNLGLSFTTYIGGVDRVSGNGYLTPSQKFPTPLKQLLPFMGKVDTKGRYRLGF